ncbi:MAG: hypothetical protein ABH859_05975 [Pseudomonadota bacterium]
MFGGSEMRCNLQNSLTFAQLLNFQEHPENYIEGNTASNPVAVAQRPRDRDHSSIYYQLADSQREPLENSPVVSTILRYQETMASGGRAVDSQISTFDYRFPATANLIRNSIAQHYADESAPNCETLTLRAAWLENVFQALHGSAITHATNTAGQRRGNTSTINDPRFLEAYNEFITGAFFDLSVTRFRVEGEMLNLPNMLAAIDRLVTQGRSPADAEVERIIADATTLLDNSGVPNASAEATRIITSAIEEAELNDPNADPIAVARSALQRLRDLIDTDGFDPTTGLVTRYVDTAVANPAQVDHNPNDDYLVFIRQIPESMITSVQGNGADLVRSLELLRGLFLEVRNREIFADEHVTNFLAGVTSLDNLENGQLAERNTFLAALDPQIADKLMAAVRERLGIRESSAAGSGQTRGAPANPTAEELIAALRSSGLNDLADSMDIIPTLARPGIIATFAPLLRGRTAATLPTRDQINTAVLAQDNQIPELVRIPLSNNLAEEELNDTQLNTMLTAWLPLFNGAAPAAPAPTASGARIPAASILDQEEGLLNVHVADLLEDEDGTQRDYNAPAGVPPEVVLHRVRFEGAVTEPGAPDHVAGTVTRNGVTYFIGGLSGTVSVGLTSRQLPGEEEPSHPLGYELLGNAGIAYRHRTGLELAASVTWLSYASRYILRSAGDDAFGLFGSDDDGHMLYRIQGSIGGTIRHFELSGGGGVIGQRFGLDNPLFDNLYNPLSAYANLVAGSTIAGANISVTTPRWSGFQLGLSGAVGQTGGINFAADDADYSSFDNEDDTVTPGNEEARIAGGGELEATYEGGDENATSGGVQVSISAHAAERSAYDVTLELGANLLTAAFGSEDRARFSLNGVFRYNHTSGHDGQSYDRTMMVAGVALGFPIRLTASGIRHIITPFASVVWSRTQGDINIPSSSISPSGGTIDPYGMGSLLLINPGLEYAYQRPRTAREGRDTRFTAGVGMPLEFNLDTDVFAAGLNITLGLNFR